MQKPVIPFEPSKWVRFTNPFDGVTDKEELLVIIANIHSSLETNSVSAMKNVFVALKRNAQDLLQQKNDPEVIFAINEVLVDFTTQGL